MSDPSESQRLRSEADLAKPAIVLDLRLDGDETPSLEQNLGSNTLLERAGQGDQEAFRQLLNQELSAYGATLAEVELRDSRLQLSISGPEVPPQDTIEPLVKEWVVQLGLVKIQKIELYGQRDGCELPFWRTEFTPSELELTTPRQKPPEIKSVVFAFSTEAKDTPLVQTVGTDVAQVPEGFEEPSVSILEPEQLLEQSRAGIDQTASPGAAEPLLEQNTAVDTSSAEQEPDDKAESVIEDAVASAKRKVVEAFLARYAAGERSFAKIDLSETDLSGINLTLADLHEAQLVWANLQDASLYHVNLLGAKLRHANLRGTKLRSANLQGVDFLNADLSGSDLSWSNLRGANLTGANLTGANLHNAVLENVIMPDGTFLD